MPRRHQVLQRRRAPAGRRGAPSAARASAALPRLPIAARPVPRGRSRRGAAFGNGLASGVLTTPARAATLQIAANAAARRGRDGPPRSGGLLDGRVARRRRRATPFGPARGAAAGFWRSRDGGQPPRQRCKTPVHARGREPGRRERALPRQPMVGHGAAGEAQLGVGREHQPGPAVGLLGQAHPRGDPPQDLLQESEGLLQIGSPAVPPPEAVQVLGGRRTRRPSRLRRRAATTARRRPGCAAGRAGGRPPGAPPSRGRGAGGPGTARRRPAARGAARRCGGPPRRAPTPGRRPRR